MDLVAPVKCDIVEGMLKYLLKHEDRPEVRLLLLEELRKLEEEDEV